MRTNSNLMAGAIAALMLACPFCEAKTIRFSGYDWEVRTSERGGPGPNNWDENNAWVDDNGYLHLKLSYRDGKWYCSEVYTQDRLGFGRYQFWVVGRVDTLDPNVVFGLFNYPTSDVGADATNEIDIEFARWGDPAAQNGNYTVWPKEIGLGPTNSTFAFRLNDANSTHRFTWSSTTVYLQSLNGHSDDDQRQFANWLFQPSAPARSISQQPMPVHINLWCFDGHPPTDAQPVELVVSSFRFTADPQAPAKLLNVSTRAEVQTGDNALIGGFIINGTDSKKIMVRATGPSLDVNGSPVPGRLENPTLELRDGSGLLMDANDNWKDTQQAAIEATGLEPKSDLESAIVRDLAPGAYTAVISGKSGGSGIGLVEVFDLSLDSTSLLRNISTRSLVESGDNVMIGGFIAGPTDHGSFGSVIRAIGPSLVQAGVLNSLPDPMLEVHDQNGTLILSNDDWETDLTADQVIAKGLAPSDSRESAIFAALTPGAYTAVVRGKGTDTGVGLVEVFNVR